MRLTTRMNAAAICAVLALTGTLAGCAHTTTMTYLPSGDTGFAINYASTTWAVCYKQAGEICGAYGL